MICGQLRKEKIRVDFNQGLDIRLLTDELINELKTIRHKEYHFAWDGKEDLTDKLIWVFKNLRRCIFYVLCGYNTTFEEDLSKLNKIKEIGHNAYCMRYETVERDPKYTCLARWVNQHHIYQGYTFDDFIKADYKHYNPLKLKQQGE